MYLQVWLVFAALGLYLHVWVVFASLGMYFKCGLYLQVWACICRSGLVFHGRRRDKKHDRRRNVTRLRDAPLGCVGLCDIV